MLSFIKDESEATRKAKNLFTRIQQRFSHLMCFRGLCGRVFITATIVGQITALSPLALESNPKKEETIWRAFSQLKEDFRGRPSDRGERSVSLIAWFREGAHHETHCKMQRKKGQGKNCRLKGRAQGLQFTFFSGCFDSRHVPLKQAERKLGGKPTPCLCDDCYTNPMKPTFHKKARKFPGQVAERENISFTWLFPIEAHFISHIVKRIPGNMFLQN